MNKSAVILDFDGTIADAEAALMKIYKSISSRYNLPELTRKDYYRLRKGSPREVMHWSGIKFWQIPKFLRIGRSEYKKHIDDITLFDGIAEVIDNLRKTHDIYVLSSNDQATVKKILKNNKLKTDITILRASSIFGKDKILKKLLRTHKYNADNSWMVGDEVRDIQAGKKAKTNTIGVSWGLQSREGLLKANPDYIAKKPEDIKKIISKGQS